MTTRPPRHPSTAECERFEAQLGPWLEHDLDTSAQTFMARHRASCANCAALATDLERIAAEAAALPAFSPTQDLWAGIASRLDAPVLPLPTAGASTAAEPRAQPPRTVSVKWFAIAATVLVAVSSGVTWQLAQRGRGDAVGVVPMIAAGAGTGAGAESRAGSALGDDDAAHADASSAGAEGTMPGQGTTQLAVGSAATVSRSTRLVAGSDQDDAEGATYEREITALRHIVDERFAELDSVTVAELRRNLGIIDRAIADSRQALGRDPRSAMLATQLDRALEAKLDLLRRVALL
jgi:hypothetical protein